jgi:Carboxypeptidase regulatory-like domain
MRTKKVSRWIVYLLVLICFIVLMSEIHPVVVNLNVINSFDGSPISANIVLESSSDEYTQVETHSMLTLDLKPDGYNIKATSVNFRPTNSFVRINSGFIHNITISLRPVGSFRGYIRHSASMKPISGITVVLTGRELNLTTTTNEDGHYFFEDITSGQYNLKTNSDTYQSFEKDYYVDAEDGFIESITLLPIDISTVHISDFNSYSISGNRNGKVAYYSDSTYVKIKKGLNGKYLIEQSFNASGSTGKSLILLDGEKAWIAEGKEKIPDEMKLQTREFDEATRLLIKTNEELLDYINQLRFTDYAEVTTVGEEIVNNVLCDKIRIYVNDPGIWIGWVDFDVHIYVMKTGKLAGLPTKITGRMKGSDEVGHRFQMNIDMSITDVGGEFELPNP